MTENKQFKIINDCGDYHLLNGDEQLCYDLCSPSTRKTNWNNVVDKLNEYDSELQMCREKAVYWRNKANDTFGDMRTNVELEKRINELTKVEFEFDKLKNEYDDLNNQLCRLAELLENDYGIDIMGLLND